VQGPNGTRITVARQVGEVSAVSPTSITVRSPDGYQRSYVVNDQTRVDTLTGAVTDLDVGQGVVVSATVDGSTATATRIRPLNGDLGGLDGLGDLGGTGVPPQLPVTPPPATNQT
jgi:hypothetical protein